MVLTLADYYHDKLVIPDKENMSRSIPENILSCASMLMLMDDRERETFSLQKDIRKAITNFDKLYIFFIRILPQRHVIAYFAGLPLHSKWIWAHYPLWYFQKSKERLIKKVSRDFKLDLKRVAQLDKWLDQ